MNQDPLGFGHYNPTPLHVPTQPQSVAPAHHKNFLESLIPSIGGVGGSVGGAALGTAILPGIGTLAGALLGGALGGGGGKVAENALEHQNLGSGVAGQAAINGILGAGPLRLAKLAGGTAMGITKGAGLADSLLNAGTKAAGPGLARTAIANKGAQLEARSAGVGVGEKVGNQQLGAKGSEDMLNLLKQEGIKPGTPEFRQKQVEDLLGQRGSQLESHINTNNVSLTAPAKKAIIADYLKNLESKAGVNDSIRKAANNFVANFNKQVTDAKSLVNFRRSLDEAINFTKNPDSADTVANQVAAKTFRTALKAQENSLIPGIKPLNESFSNLTKLNKALLGASKKVSDQSEAGGSGITSTLLKNDTMQGLKSAVGSGAQKVRPTSNAFGVKGAATRIGGGNLLLGNLTQGQNGASPDLSSALMQAGAAPVSPGADQTSSSMQSPYPLENALYDISRDPKNASTYEALYKFANPDNTPAPLNAEQQKEVTASQAAIGRIKQYGQQLESASGGNVATGSISTLLGKYDPFASSSQKQAAALQSSRRDVAIQLATALMGGNKPSAQSVDEIEQSLPSVNDSPELRQAKLQAIISGLQENLKNYATPVSQITANQGFNTGNGDVGTQLNSVLNMIGAQ